MARRSRYNGVLVTTNGPARVNCVSGSIFTGKLNANAFCLGFPRLVKKILADMVQWWRHLVPKTFENFVQFFEGPIVPQNVSQWYGRWLGDY
jgi:hypothetical protein